MGKGRELIAPLLHPDCAHKRGGHTEIKIKIYTGDQYRRDTEKKKKKEERERKKLLFFLRQIATRRDTITREHTLN